MHSEEMVTSPPLNLANKERLFQSLLSVVVVYVSVLSVCIFVALCVWMSAAGANKVEGTMSWCLGTNEILASKHDIAKGQTRALWDRHLDSS